jgi:hypothetical protein
MTAPASVPAPAPITFAVGAKGLEYSIRDKLRASPSNFSWQEVYAATIAVNLKALCSPQRRAQAGESGDPLNAIGSAELFAWPSLDEVKAHRADARACPLPAVVTSLPG